MTTCSGGLTPLAKAMTAESGPDQAAQTKKAVKRRHDGFAVTLFDDDRLSIHRNVHRTVAKTKKNEGGDEQPKIWGKDGQGQRHTKRHSRDADEGAAAKAGDQPP